MNKNQQKKMIWVVTWAVLLLLVLYSPIGSPDLYRTSDVYFQSQGVQFNGQGIKNASNFQTLGDNNVDNYITSSPLENSIVSNYKPITSYSSSKGTTYHSNNTSSNRTYAGNTGTSNQSSAGYMGGGSNLYLRSTTSASLSSTSKVNSISSSSDLFVNENTVTRQSASAATNGGTDPGGDPTDPPIPIGEGLFAMIFFAFVYIVFKRKIF